MLTVTFFGGSVRSAGNFTSECPALKSAYKRNLFIYRTPKTESNSHPPTAQVEIKHTTLSPGVREKGL